MAQAAPLSCPHHEPFPCSCILSHRVGLCRHICPWAGEAEGVALVLLSFCSSQALKDLGVRGKLGELTTIGLN